MTAVELISELQKLVDAHGDLPVKVDVSKVAPAPVAHVYFVYNDTETDAWVELDLATR